MWTRNTPSILALVAVLGACGPGQLAVTAELEVADPEGGGTMMQPIADTEVQFVPFDRDAIFDSLTSAASSPEPPIPDSVSQLIVEVQAAQAAWREQDTRWQTLRDSLKVISDAMGRLDQASEQYRTLFLEWLDFDQEVTGLERSKEGAFAEFTGLQGRTDEIFRDLRLLRTQWAEDAFIDYGTIIDTRMRNLARETLADTTDTMGTVRVELRPGQWWVHARYALPFEELYWNIPVTAVRGEVVEITLSRATAEIRRTLR